MPQAEYDALLRRRRVWGVPPDAVAQMIAQCERDQSDLRDRVTDLESRLADALAQRDEAKRTVSAQQEQIVRLEREKEAIANRHETVREEAVRFVVDAYAEVQTLREQTQREITTAQEEAHAAITALRREVATERERHEADMTETRQRYEAEITMLRERRARAVAELESLAAGLLSQAGRGETPPTPAPTEREPDATPPAAPVTAEHYPPQAAHPMESDPPAHANGGSEDAMLARALDELEAILSLPRKQNGA